MKPDTKESIEKLEKELLGLRKEVYDYDYDESVLYHLDRALDQLRFAKRQ